MPRGIPPPPRSGSPLVGPEQSQRWNESGSGEHCQGRALVVVEERRWPEQHADHAVRTRITAHQAGIAIDDDIVAASFITHTPMLLGGSDIVLSAWAHD